MKTTTVFVLVLAVAGCSMEGAESTGTAESAVKNQTVTRISVNGRSSYVNLVDDNTGANGFLNASKDDVAGTSGLDFSYVTPSTTDPDIVILVQGAGEIPNEAYTTTATSAHLMLAATPFSVLHCDINLVTGDFTCAVGDPIAFDLTWMQNGFSRVTEKVKRTEQIGPLTTKFKGEFDERSAVVNGTWNGDVADNISGTLLDNTNTTVIREITMAQ